MKTAILFYFLAASCFAQQVPEKVKKTTVNKDQVPNLSDAFAKASLVALKAIEADSSEPKLREGQFLVNGYVQKLIEAADLEASLIAERALVINLRGLMISKEANNTERSIVALKASSDLYASHKTPNELLISDIVAKDPGMIEMEAKKAGIADFHWHDLRHTFATRLREAGVDIYTLMRLTRRRDIKSLSLLLD
jgi:Phage integrase family